MFVSITEGHSEEKEFKHSSVYMKSWDSSSVTRDLGTSTQYVWKMNLIVNQVKSFYSLISHFVSRYVDKGFLGTFWLTTN